MTPRALWKLVVLWVVLYGATAFGQGGTNDPPSGAACGTEALRWVARCNASHGAGIRTIQCPTPGLFVVITPAVHIELVHDTTRGFRHARDWGLSPVGVSGEWSSIPAETRDAFDRVVACVNDDDGLPTVHAEAPRRRPPDTQTRRPTPRPEQNDRRINTDHDPTRMARVRWPWRLLLASALMIAAWWPLRRRRGAGVHALRAVGLCAAVVGIRSVLFSPSFVHQNGQGPMWIGAALGDWQPYGPGYPELFSAVAGLSPTYPDVAVFVAQSLLAGVGVACAYGLARRSGASTQSASFVATALTVCLLVDPTLGRLSRSESYFSTCLSLELIAAWAITHGRAWPRGAVARLRALVPLVAAGLLLSLCVAVHPVAWIPAAMVPLVAAVGSGSLRRRARHTVITGVVVGVVVLVTALPGVLDVLHGEMGQRWVTHGHWGLLSLPRTAGGFKIWLAGTALTLALVQRWRRVIPRALVVLPALVVIPLTDVVTAAGSRPYLTDAFAWIHAPVMLAALAAALAGVAPVQRARVVATVITIAGVVFAVKNHATHTALTTDALEQRAAMAWRDQLPDGATVWFLSRAENSILSLPIYPAVDRRHRSVHPLQTGNTAPPITGDRAYWYRSSVCSTQAGRAYCEAIEQRLRLAPVRTDTFPALWSIRHVTYDRPRVAVGLYRVLPATP